MRIVAGHTRNIITEWGRLIEFELIIECEPHHRIVTFTRE